ncbi:SIR2 family protein [Thermodesulfobacteriota bacterium]
MSILQEQTVFILGAGASKPFGFPLGPELKSTMLDRANDGTTRRRLQSLGFEESHIIALRDALQYGAHPTVDIFLEKKSNFRKLGSYLIASAIIPLENHSLLFPQKDWYGHLFDVLGFEFEEPDASLLKVVTLNYDRSFEHFMWKNIDYNCQHDRVQFAHAKREKIQVVHAHGSLGSYPDVPYGVQRADVDALSKAAESIKIVSDRLDESPAFCEAQAIIAQSEHIVFLGFGYNEDTLSSLLAKAELENKQVYGTAMGLGSRTGWVREFFHDNVDLGEDNRDCDSFLQSIGIFPTNPST